MGISFRAFSIGVVAAILVSLIVSWAELVVMYIQVGFLQLPPVVVGLFVFLIVANTCAKHLHRRLGLSPQELLTIYCMMLFSSMISSRGLLEKLLPLLVTPAYFANDGNSWVKLYFPNIKQWLVPFELDQGQKTAPLVAKRFFEGMRDGEHIPWQQWIGPLVLWGILALLIFGAFLFLASILRRQWVDNEKLTFPLAQLPLEMVREDRETGFFQNKYTWFGFAIPVIVFTINGLNQLYPSIPKITLEIPLHSYATNPPMSYIGYTPMFLSFAAVGFFFLLPAEILFSLWFFFVLTRVQQVVAGSYNMDMIPMPIYPTKMFIGYQVMGAYFVLAGYLLYVSLPHLKKVWKATIGAEKVNDSNELVPYKTALIGLTLCVLGAAIWLKYIAGMSGWLALFMLGIYVFIVAVVMARSTAEGGLLMTETSFRPVDVYRMFAPTHTLGPANMTALAFADAGFFRDLRGLVLTGFLDGLKIADGARIKRRSFLPVFVVAILVAMLIGGYAQIYLPYAKGGIHLYGYAYTSNNVWGFQDYEPAMRGPVAPVGWQAPTFFIVGVVVTIFLAYMRYAFFWWPLHPLGYALCASWTMIVFWFPCFIAWLLKSQIMKYGGMKTYIKARPFFLGMVMGEFSAAVIWAIISWATNVPAPAFPWP